MHINIPNLCMTLVLLVVKCQTNGGKLQAAVFIWVKRVSIKAVTEFQSSSV